MDSWEEEIDKPSPWDSLKQRLKQWKQPGYFSHLTNQGMRRIFGRTPVDYNDRNNRLVSSCLNDYDRPETIGKNNRLIRARFKYTLD